MSRSSISGGQSAPQQAEGRDVDALGPSDTSDSGSDVAGITSIDAADELGNIGQEIHSGRAGASDSGGTGERGSAVLGDDAEDGFDILPDRIGDADAASDAELDSIEDLMDDDQPDEIPEDPIEPERADPGGRTRKD